jgi:6-pyruvoyl-tetrahydropterin synthase
VDIGRAGDTLKRVLAELNFRNLDDVPAFAGRNTTTEFLARIVFDQLVAAIRSGGMGPGASGIERIRVTLHESHVAAASYEAPVARA